VADAWLVALWVTILVAALLAALRLLARHWMLAAGSGIAAFLLWQRVLDEAFVTLGPAAARLHAALASAQVGSFSDGPFTGSFGELSTLAVSLSEIFSGFLGSGAAAGRSASMLTALGALLAIYALGNRAAGRVGACVALAVAVIADPFRIAAADGSDAAALILAATVFLLALHACLAEANRFAVALLGAAAGLAVLANPIWFGGVVVGIVAVVVLYGIPRERFKALAVGLAVLAALTVCNRISAAQHHDGDVLGDVTRTATLVRNIEFTGKGRGAPPPGLFAEDPFAGRPVGLTEYLFDDHSLNVLVGGTLIGAGDGLDAAASWDDSKLLGLVAWVLTVLGTLYLLIVPRLRVLLIVGFTLAVPGLFFASRHAVDPFTALAPVWPAAIAAAGVAVFVARRLWDERDRVLDPDGDPDEPAEPPERAGGKAPALAGTS
jgi:hypothetical protein